MRVAADDGARLFLDIDGLEWAFDGPVLVRRPTVMILHGGPGPDHRRSKLWARPLADIAQLVFLDQRGHGRSDLGAGTGTPTLARWADDVAAVCAALEIVQPVLLGVSFGGFVAQTVAIRHPALASALVLMSTSARNDPDLIAAAMSRAGGEAAAQTARAFYAGPRDLGTANDYMRHCMPLYTTRPDRQPAIDDPWNVALTASFTDPGTGEFLRDDRRKALASVTTPTLVLGGERDPITPIEAARELWASFPPGVATLRGYAGASHALPFDAPECLDDVRAFLAGIAR